MTDIANVNDGQWHGHNGKEMPDGLHEESIVDLRWLHSERANNGVTARGWKWSLVCAYRVTTAHVEKPKPRDFWVIGVYAAANKVDAAFHQLHVGGEIIHVREVLE